MKTLRVMLFAVGLGVGIIACAGHARAESDRVITGELVVLPGSTSQFRIVGHSGAFSAPAGVDVTALDGKTVEVEVAGGKATQIVPRPVPINPVAHGWSTVRGVLETRDALNGRFTFHGDDQTYTAPSGVNVSVYDGKMVEAKLDETGRIVELIPVGPAPAQAVNPAGAPSGSCSYGGATYSAGAAVCQSGTQYRCDGNQWQSLGVTCTATAADAPLNAGVRSPRSCAVGDATVASGSSVCRQGTTFRCDDGAWLSLGTACR
jgi:hypothetical protein